MHCLETLRVFDTRPAYLSIEAIEQDIDKQKRQIDLLSELGYDAFKAVQQARMHRRTLPERSTEGLNVPHQFPKGSSGPFGGDLSGAWHDDTDILAEYDAIFTRNRRFTDSAFWKSALFRKPIRRFMEWSTNTTIPGWYDTHARHASHTRKAQE